MLLSADLHAPVLQSSCDCAMGALAAPAAGPSLRLPSLSRIVSAADSSLLALSGLQTLQLQSPVTPGRTQLQLPPSQKARADPSDCPHSWLSVSSSTAAHSGLVLALNSTCPAGPFVSLHLPVVGDSCLAAATLYVCLCLTVFVVPGS